MIHSAQLQNPEQGLGLENREEPQRKRAEPAEVRALRERLAGFEARLAAAKALKPEQLHGGHKLHNCRTCAERARDATVKAIEGA